MQAEGKPIELALRLKLVDGRIVKSGGKDLALIPQYGQLLVTRTQNAGFTLVQWRDRAGWVDSTHIIPLAA